jgi:O-acetyl-ADP-ribose deacetylase (regulator of RNase III)
VNIISGDLLELAEYGEFDIIVQGCNCFNTMGSGIAKQIADRYPNARAADQATTKGDINKLGTYTMASSHHSSDREAEFVIVNAYTQFDYNRPGVYKTDKFEYTAFKTILRKLSHKYGESRFGFPLIGMGLAGGRPQEIINILQEFALDIEDQGGTVTVVEYV